MTTTIPADLGTGPATPAFSATLGHGNRLILAGELDIAGVEALRAALDQLMLERDELLRIDASRLTFIDSLAISVLLRYQLAASVLHRKLFLESVSRQVGQLLELLDLRHLLLDGSAVEEPALDLPA
jgi:anti-anti-sigma factor